MEESDRSGGLGGLYDELWKDARTMILDLNRCVSAYWVTGLWMSVWGFNFAVFGLAGWYRLLTGTVSVFYLALALGGTLGGLAQLVTGPLLIYWYFRFQRRYPDLIPPPAAVVRPKPAGDDLRELKRLYDGLWKDASGLIADMNRSIAVYGISGALYFAYGLVFLGWAALVFREQTGPVDILVAGCLLLGCTPLLMSPYLIYWYFKLKKRYARLIRMETAVGD